ncbi:MAG: 50S ribosomal protein L1 [Candidatus Doudnabacteria bacterium]|nr:50S ribosomal protein L1 [Candidatus Doudnabacteria bacterium]
MSKRYSQVVQLVDRTKTYPIEEAVALARQTSTVKFDATVEAHFKLGIDAKQTDQKVRTQITLPHGTGKTIKVAAFVSSGKEKEAKAGGADIIGGEELVKQIKETGKADFDAAVAEPAMMKSLAQIAKILGQRGLMPNPKAGTVGEDVGRLVKELKGGRVEIKTDDTGVVHAAIGKVSFDEQKLLENFQAVKEALYRAKPSAVKKDFVKSVTISTSMGPGIKVSL